MSEVGLRPNDVVVTGVGLVTPVAKTLGEAMEKLEEQGPRSLDDYSLEGFRAASHLKNKKLLKTVSWYHGFGLVAVERCRDASGLSEAGYDSQRLGLFVGAPPSSCYDNANYFPAVEDAREGQGASSERAFGAHSQNVLGTTLLKGLPNNVLCYGSMILGAKGPNSNYVAGATSGHLALMGALRSLTLGRLDAAVAGAYAYSSDPVTLQMRRCNGELWHGDEGDVRTRPLAADSAGMVPSDGSAFVSLETRKHAQDRGASVLATIVGTSATSDGAGPRASDAAEVDALATAMSQALDRAGISSEQVGVVFASGNGDEVSDRFEADALRRVFGGHPSVPAVAALSPLFGNLVEAGGLVELGLLREFYGRGRIPGPIAVTSGRLAADGFTGRDLPASKPYAMILRASPEGEFTCVLASVPFSSSD